MISLLLEQERDAVARENFQKIEEYFRTETLLATGFQAFEIRFNTTVTDRLIAHGLSFKPNMALQVLLLGDGTVTLDHDSFTDKDFTISVSGTVTHANPTIVRYLFGSLKLERINIG